MIHMSGSTCLSIFRTSFASSTPVVSISETGEAGPFSSSKEERSEETFAMAAASGGRDTAEHRITACQARLLKAPALRRQGRKPPRPRRAGHQSEACSQLLRNRSALNAHSSMHIGERQPDHPRGSRIFRIALRAMYSTYRGKHWIELCGKHSVVATTRHL
jgi:hypothetical protein